MSYLIRFLIALLWIGSLWSQSYTLESKEKIEEPLSLTETYVGKKRRLDALGESTSSSVSKPTLKKLPIDVSTFRTLIQGNYLYVDKTRDIHDHILSARYFFYPRPRRFGKSLLISTLEEIFAGNSELFTGCWIGASDYQWPKHPVISLDFSKLDSDSPQELKLSLSLALERIANQLSIDLSKYPSPGLKLDELVCQLSKKNSVVVLIDEYDSPLLNNLHKPSVAQENRDVLRNFFNVLKSLDAKLRAIFITGIAKFSKTSIFSGLNNLNDISLDPEGATLCGYTESDLERYFKNHFEILASKEGKSVDEIRQQVRAWYNGYRFSEDPTTVYNPYSILYLFKKNKFLNYWFESGTPSFLVSMFKKECYSLEDIEGATLSSRSLGAFDVDSIPLITVLFQTGYLTIHDYEKSSNSYRLGYPNNEVRESFTLHLLAAYTGNEVPAIENITRLMRNALDNSKVDEFVNYLKVLFAHIPYQLHISQEKYYHSLFQLLGLLIGYETDSEISTNKGRIDAALKSKNHIYVIEIKLAQDQANALTQIETNTYYERYLLSGKKIILVGLAFNPDRNKLSIEYTSKELT